MNAFYLKLVIINENYSRHINESWVWKFSAQSVGVLESLEHAMEGGQGRILGCEARSTEIEPIKDVENEGEYRPASGRTDCVESISGRESRWNRWRPLGPAKKKIHEQSS